MARARGGGAAPALPGGALLGAAAARASAIRGRASWWSGSPRPPTAATAPGGSSPAIAPATGCSRRSTAPGSPTSPTSERARRRAAARGAPTSPRSTAARRRRTARPPRSATTACPTWSASCGCCGGARVLVALGSYAWDGLAAGAGRARRGDAAPAARASATAPRPDRGRRAELVPARLLSPEPAEHLHRQADRADAGRGLRARRRARRGSIRAGPQPQAILARACSRSTCPTR